MSRTVRLIAFTGEPSRLVAAAAKLCYSASSVEELYDGLGDGEITRFLKILRDSGHESPFEHASFTFAIEGVSRVATHQLVRHRIASFSQRSQRYVTMGDAKYVAPPSVKQNEEAAAIFEKAARDAHEAYGRLASMGVPKEDARFILPHGWETSIIVTMNARELAHFFRLRLCRRAQWEIRATAREMLALAYGAAPELFESCGPRCLSGGCAEKKPCGRPYASLEEVLADL
jgi:thymidylate synthase (FAD)